MFFSCETEHNEHKIVSFEDFRTDIEKTKKRLIKIKKEVEDLLTNNKSKKRK